MLVQQRRVAFFIDGVWRSAAICWLPAQQTSAILSASRPPGLWLRHRHGHVRIRGGGAALVILARVELRFTIDLATVCGILPQCVMARLAACRLSIPLTVLLHTIATLDSPTRCISTLLSFTSSVYGVFWLFNDFQCLRRMGTYPELDSQHESSVTLTTQSVWLDRLFCTTRPRLWLEQRERKEHQRRTKQERWKQQRTPTPTSTFSMSGISR